MLLQHWMAVALLALPLAAEAQERTKPISPADPAAPVAAPVYESAFAGYQPLSDEKEPPDKIWRNVNQEIGTLGGHAGHTKVAPGSSSADTAPATGKDAPKGTSAPAGRDMHQHGGK